MPRLYDPRVNGHQWRVLVFPHGNTEKIVTTLLPWTVQTPNGVLVSEDGGGLSRSVARVYQTIASARAYGYDRT